MDRIIMAGDPKQLSAYVKPDFDDLDENELVMERVMIENPNNSNYIMLSVQYRMKPEIMRIASELFYDGQLRAHESVENIDIRDILSGMPVVFCDTTPNNFENSML